MVVVIDVEDKPLFAEGLPEGEANLMSSPFTVARFFAAPRLVLNRDVLFILPAFMDL